MARRKSITKRRRGLFLAELLDTGSVTAAAVAGEISRQSWYDLRARDTDFRDEWDECETGFADNLETIAIERGTIGTPEKRPYVHVDGDTKKTKFHTIHKKSDRLLELCLKARHPAYTPTKEVQHTSPDGSMTPVAAIARADYSKLSNEELETLTRLQRKAHAGAG